MSWKKVELKDICKIKSGKRLPKGSDFSSEVTNYPYIRARDIKNGSISSDDLVYLDEETHKKISKYIVNTNDIVITVVGASVGDVGFVKKEFDGFNLTENAIRLTDYAKTVSPRYLLYILNSKEYWELMQQIAGGSAQPKLGIYKVESISAELPPINTQIRIADILSAYDDLIENNQKQIKLLEEAAQRLYKEWFVDFRFPGHENTTFVDGLPEGWSLTNLSSICIFKRGKTITKNETKIGSVPVVAGGLEPAYYHNVANTKAPVITVSGSGANAGFSRLYFEDVFASDCSYADFNTTNCIYFVYSFLKENKGLLDSLQKGSAQPHVYAKDINNLPLLLPPDEITNNYCKLVKPIFEKERSLLSQIKNLTEARDRLLPKLMSGEIEI